MSSIGASRRVAPARRSVPGAVAVVAAALLMAGLGGCREGGDGPMVRMIGVANDTKITVVVVEIRTNRERRLGDVAAGQTGWFDDLQWGVGPNGRECTVYDLAVRTADGTEIARIPPPVCTGPSRAVSDYLLPAPS